MKPIKSAPIKVGDYVEVYDLRDGAKIDVAQVKAIAEDDAPGVGKRLVASLSVGYSCAVKCLKKIAKTRTGTHEETLKFLSDMTPRDAKAAQLPDGNQQAVRVMLDNITGLPTRSSDNHVVICAPWLLSDIFFV
jgi:hypothetical protein